MQDDDVPHAGLVIPLDVGAAFLFPNEGAEGDVGVEAGFGIGVPNEGAGAAILLRKG